MSRVAWLQFVLFHLPARAFLQAIRRPRCSVALALLVLPTLATAQSPSGDGLESTLEYVAPWAPWLTILLVAAAAVFCVAIYLHEQIEHQLWIKLALAAFRFSLICLVLWMMYGFTLRPYRTDLPDLLLIIDDSQSMATIDAPADDARHLQLVEQLKKLQLPEASRLNQAKSILLQNDRQIVSFLQQHYQVKLVTLDSPAMNATDMEQLVSSVSEISPGKDRSALGQTLREALQRQRGHPVAAVVYLTDGITTDGPPLSQIAAEANQRGVPLHLVGLGSERPAKDVHISDLLVDEVAFVGDMVTFDFVVTGNGYEDAAIDVTLKRKDGTGETATQRIKFTKPRDAQPVRLAFRAEEEGVFEFVVETPSLAGEVTPDNNSVQATVQVRDETTKVLLVQSYPSYEFHYLKTLLERGSKSDQDGSRPNGSVKLSVLLQDADPEFAEIDRSALRSFPSREELFEYDVCIFGDVNPSLLGSEAMNNLRDFVRERGRGFVGIAGPRYFPVAYVDSPLSDLMPFDVRSALAAPPDLPIEKGFRPRITPLGNRMRAMQLAVQSEDNTRLWAELPEIYWLLEVDELKPGVRVLSEHPDRTGISGRSLPVTTLSYVGAGKVLFHFTDDSWRWRISRGDELFGRYWQQSIRYLSRFKLGEGRDVELTSDREIYERGEIVRLRARFFDERKAPPEDDGVTVIVQQKGSGQRRVVLKQDIADRGIFSGTVANLATGSYHCLIAEPLHKAQAPSTDFEVTAPHAEMTRLEMDAGDLRQAANVSGGEFYTYENAAKLIGKLPTGRQVRIESLPPIPIWNTWKIALIFLVVLLCEWILRRHFGMT